jgi:hypothetical protein
MAAPIWRFTAEQDPNRLRALEPYLQKLRRWNDDSGVQDGTIERAARIRVGARTLSVGAWERIQIQVAFREEMSATRDAARLMALAVALLTKSYVDVERFNAHERSAATDFYALQAELMLDSAIGASLLQETQTLVDALVIAGKVEEAKKVSEFRHKLHGVVGEVKKIIADSEAALAEELGLGTPKPPVSVDGTLDRLAQKVADEVERIERRKRSRKLAGEPREAPDADESLLAPALFSARSRKPRTVPNGGLLPVAPSFDRTRALAAILAILILAWAGLVEVPRHFETEPPAAPILEASHPNLFEELQSRPPSLYVTVRSIPWSTLGETERRSAVERAGRDASERGYRGVVFRTHAGRPVAQWLSASGAKLIPPAEPAGPAEVAETD